MKFARDIESNWVTKNDKHYYGLKEHTSVDATHGFVLATVLSKASVHVDNCRLLIKKSISLGVKIG